MKLSEEAKEARNLYQRKWRAKNPEKLNAYNASYWERKAQKELQAPQTLCLNCGEPFQPKRQNGKFCSDKCRVAYNRKRR